MNSRTIDAVLLLVQVVAIVLLSRTLAILVARVGQPAVIGEMVAGVMLGPSLLGWAWPAAAQALFPAGSLEPLRTLGQAGLVVFMFLLGVRTDSSPLRHHARPIALLAICAAALPFICGTAVGWLWFSRASPDVPQGWPSILFVGLAMSVTAFPVLARILESQRLQGTRIGTIALACAAVSDTSAWVVLAVLTSLAPGGADGGERLGGLLLAGSLFVGVMVRPWLRAAVPRLQAVVDPPLALLVLPVFFAATGLQTDITVLTSTSPLAAVSLLALLVAIVSKMLPPLLMTGPLGVSPREGLLLGLLLNTRGLVELVILNVGLQAGLITPDLFSALVVMALVTTAMASPLLTRLRRAAAPENASAIG